MSNLLGALRNAAGAMRVVERGMAVVQSNVTNASTPGYARQRQVLTAMPSDLDQGLVGGVASGGTLGSRNLYAEQGVRRQAHLVGAADERAAHLSRLEPAFSIDGTQGIGGAMSRFFQAASALAVTPNDGAARQHLLSQAGMVAAAFQHASSGLTNSMSAVDGGVQANLNELHAIGARLQQLNRQFKQDFRAQDDPGMDAQLTSMLEELAAIADFTMLRAEDGSVSIFVGGQTPLVIGERLYSIGAVPAAGGTALLDHEGRDITSQITGGRIATLLELRNTLLPGYQQRLDHLAERLASEVNATLASGVDLDGNAPAVDLFAFDAGAGAARTLQVTGITTAQLAMASPAAPGGNANALALAGLEQRGLIDGATFAQTYGALAGRVGRDLSSARDESSIQRHLAAQARELRDEVSRVNLDEEAIALMEFQRAYQATAKLVQTVDEMMETVIGLIR
jgi:flagellar hook-associated protein 1